MKFLLASLLLSATLIGAQNTPVEIPEEQGTHIGQLRGSEHSIAGSLYAVDENILLLKKFEYDGEAKDAFFWVGTSGDTPSTTGTILPYPFSGIFYQSEDVDAPFLYGVFNGSTDVRLTLPEDLKVSDLKWFSIWSRAEKKSFGEVIFPEGFSLDKKYPTSVNSGALNNVNNPTIRTTETSFSNTELPPPLLSGNVHDPRRVDNWAKHDNDHEVDPEAESEAEPESKDDNDHHGDHRHEQERFQTVRNTGSNVWASMSLLLVSSIVAKSL